MTIQFSIDLFTHFKEKTPICNYAEKSSEANYGFWNIFSDTGYVGITCILTLYPVVGLRV